MNTQAQVEPPHFREKSQVYKADRCDPLIQAVQAGQVDLQALVRGQYPGRPLSGDELRGVRSVGFWDARYAQNWGLDWHRNEGIELTFLSSGQVEFEVDDLAHTLGPGHLTITRPWQRHRVGRPHVGPGRLHWLILDVGVRRPNQDWKWPHWILLTHEDRERLTRILRQNEQPVWRTSSDLRHCWDRLAQAVQEDVDGNRLSHVAVYINELLVLLLELFDGQSIVLDESLSSSQRTVSLFLEELSQQREQLARGWQVEEMAAACGLGVTHFTRLCKQLTNLTPNAYLNQCRIHAAVQLLSDHPDISVTEVAHQCGFNTSQYFATLLRRMTNTTPSEIQRGARRLPNS